MPLKVLELVVSVRLRRQKLSLNIAEWAAVSVASHSVFEHEFWIGEK